MLVTTLRPVRLPDDLEPLWEIAVACEGEVLDETVTTREEIRSLLEGPDQAPDGTRVAVDSTGRPIGFVSVEIDPTGREISVDTYASPGVGVDVLDALLQHGVTYARGHAAAQDGQLGWVAISGAFPTDLPYRAALARVGYLPVRRFHRMRADLDPSRPVAVPPLPEGAEIQVVGEDEVTQRVVHGLVEDAFTEHWRHSSHTWDDFSAHVRNRGYDPSQWWLATVDGEPAGALIGNDTLVELDAGYVSMLGVLKPYRGLGLGRALLLTAFAESARRGRTSIRLGVDTENGTGAPALYASVGMTPGETIDAYELPLN
jgi:mycothiol synthase